MNRDFGKLERDVPTVPHDFGAALDQLLAQRSHRLVLDLIGQGQRPEEVAHVANESTSFRTDTNGGADHL